MRVKHRWATTNIVILLAGCSGSPTAPSPPIVTPPPVVVVPPPVVTLPPDPILTDPRFDRAFYRQFVLNGYDSPGQLEPLRRQTEAPRIYLRTIDDAGRAMDVLTLNETAAALENVAGSLTGRFGLAGLERGTETREGQRGWITVRWSATAGPCGTAVVGGDLIILYPRSAGCRCSGGAAVKPLIVKHELGHALGFRHTDSLSDLMHNGGHTTCDMPPSAREIFHAALAYSRPLGSLEP